MIAIYLLRMLAKVLSALIVLGPTRGEQIRRSHLRGNATTGSCITLNFCAIVCRPKAVPEVS
jgi:hypothetical protein